MSTFQNAVSTDARSSTFNHIHGNQTNINYTYSIDDEKILAVLKPVELQDVPRCMDGTREDIFKTINSWLNDFRAPNILWISGSPRAGKSAIASSLVSELAEERRLASCFFCKRSDASLGNPSSLWRRLRLRPVQCRCEGQFDRFPQWATYEGRRHKVAFRLLDQGAIIEASGKIVNWPTAGRCS